MADAEDKDMNIADEGKSSKKGLILIIIGAVVLIGISIGATLFLTGALSSDEEDAPTEQAEAEEPVEEAPPIYLALDPPLVVNFEQASRARFLQVTLEVMARDSKVIDDVKLHMPVLRNNLNMLFSGQNAQQIGTREGKEQLRQAALAEIQKVLEERTGAPGVEDLYFTSFVMQ